MGNNSCTCPCSFDRLQFPNLQRKSVYGAQQKALDKKMISAMVSSNYEYNKYSMVQQVINKSKYDQFYDDKFQLGELQSSRLSQLLNYNKNNIKVFQLFNSTNHSNFVQLNIQFSYLSCVFYFYCNQHIKEEWLQHVIQTNQTNQKGYYILNYYCNGRNHSIVIDDYVPTNKESFLYLRIITGKQIWPLLMEKGWAKQIGSYTKAFGLSPEDVFQQITGIPAYSYQIRQNNRVFIRKLIQSSYRQRKWITLVARKGLQSVLNRQVFYLKSIDNGYYTIISPFTKFQFEQSQQTKRGEATIRQQSIFNYFQYLVIGHYKPGFKNSSTHIKSKSHEQLIYQFTVNKRQQLSIRLNQFYKEYINDDYKDKYQYSPILMQIYQIVQHESQTEFIIRQSSQGCGRANYGARSIYSTRDIFEQFKPGRYFIRLQIYWPHQQYLNQANLNIYSLNGQIRAQQIINNNQFLFEVYPLLIKSKLQQMNNYKQDRDQQIFQQSIDKYGLMIITYIKKNTTLMMFQNKEEFKQTFQVSFQKSQNIFIRGGKVNKKKTILQIKGNSQTVIEIIPLKILEESQITNFQITKIQQKNR